MVRPTRRTAVLPLTAAILFGTAGSALAIPDTDPNNPPPPPPNQAPIAALNVTPNPGLVAPSSRSPRSAPDPGRRTGQRPEPQRGQLRRLRLQRPRRVDLQVPLGPRRQRHVREVHDHAEGQPQLHPARRLPRQGPRPRQRQQVRHRHEVPEDPPRAGREDRRGAAGHHGRQGEHPVRRRLHRRQRHRQVRVGPRRQRHVRDEHRHEPDRPGAVHDRRPEDRPRQGDRLFNARRRPDDRQRAPGPRRRVQRLAEPRARR